MPCLLFSAACLNQDQNETHTSWLITIVQVFLCVLLKCDPGTETCICTQLTFFYKENKHICVTGPEVLKQNSCNPGSLLMSLPVPLSPGVTFILDSLSLDLFLCLCFFKDTHTQSCTVPSAFLTHHLCVRAPVLPCHTWSVPSDGYAGLPASLLWVHFVPAPHMTRSCTTWAHTSHIIYLHPHTSPMRGVS